MFSFEKKCRRSAGVVTAEFAIIMIFFITIICGVIEFARVMYMLNTVQMVTRRAAALAANADLSSGAAMSAVRQQSVFRNSPGSLVLGAPVTDAYVRIRYLSIDDVNGSVAEIPLVDLPACPANNRANCMRNPYSATCVRLVRAQICDPAVANECRGVKYQALFSLVGLSFDLPKATAISNVETLGAPPGEQPCP
nr:TadE/TadG family type IV pilus assembly protein [uncultured Duganella sp.]